MENRSNLKSVLGRRDVFALAFGAIIGWGWVVLSGSLIETAGTLGSMLAFLLGACLVGFVGLTYAELTSAMPRAGGELAFTYRALGPGWSWVCGWSLVLAYVGVCAFESVAIATVVGYLLPQLQRGYLYSVAGSEIYASWILIGAGTGIFMGTINWFGIKTSAIVQWLATAGLILVGCGFFLGSNLYGDPANLTPYFTNPAGVLQVVILTPFLMLGFDIIPQASEEIRIPTREIGRIILFSIALATTWYVLVQWGVGLSLSHEAQRASELPTADAAARVFGTPLAAGILVLGGLLGIVTSWNAFFVGATRLVYGMARAKMLPAALARLHSRHRTPLFAVVFVTAGSLLAPFWGRKALLWLANASSLGAVVAFFLVALSFVRLRRVEPEMPRPYRLSHGTFVGAGAVVISFGFILLYLPGSPSALVWPYEWSIILAWIILGLGAFSMGRKSHPDIDAVEREEVILGDYRRQAIGGGIAKSPGRVESE